MDFLRRVIGDDYVPNMDVTGNERADEIEGMSLEAYAEKERITLANPDRQVIEHALKQLSLLATREERARAITKAREALETLPQDASEAEELQAAREAVASVADECERRLRLERILPRTWFYLPSPSLDKDKAEAKRIVVDLLADMPANLSHYQVEAEIKEALKPLTRKIEARNRRREQIEHGRRHVATVLHDLYRDDAISLEEWLDYELRKDLEEAVADALREELTGSETTGEVEEIVAEVVAEELDLEPAEEDADDEEDY